MNSKGFTDEKSTEITAEQKEKAEKIIRIYANFGVKIGECIGVASGPRVTSFEFQLEPDTQISKITKFRDDISLMLSVPKVRIICPVPGKMAFAVEIPDNEGKFVDFEEAFSESENKLSLTFGKNLYNENIRIDLSKAPHILIGGQSCSGKTNILKSMALSLICNNEPDEIKLLLISPDKSDFEVFGESDYLLEPIISDPQTAIDSLNSLCEECDKRFKLFQENSVRNLDAYNSIADESLSGIVVIVDEMSFLSRYNLRDFEYAVCRLAQMGRPAGIHIVLATKELTPNNVTGIMKANIPTRIALSTRNAMESRTIMDACDGECLLLKGDALLCVMLNKPQRIQTVHITDLKISKILKSKKK